MAANGPPPGPPPLANTALSDVDTDGNGAISEDELKTALEKNAPPGASTDMAADMFKKIDTDGNGSISSTEWDSFQQAAANGPQGSSSTTQSQTLKDLVSQVYGSADADGNGSLTKDEMTAWLQKAMGSTSVSFMA
jgi:Ca2+-binding EF-hand superfamily protein